MKTLLFLLFAVSLFADAQTSFEKTVKPQFYADFVKILTDTNGHWIAAGSYQDLSSGFFTPGYIVEFDSWGDTLWSKNFVDTGETVFLSDFIRTNDNNYVLTGITGYCDFGDRYIFLKKVNSNGNPLWVKYFLNDYSSTINVPVIQLSDSGYLFSRDSLLYVVDVNGDSIGTDTLSHGNILTFIENRLHQYIVGSVYGITVVDSSGSTLNFYSFSGGVRTIIQLQDSSYIALSGNSVLFLDTSFTPYRTTNLSTDFASAKTIKYAANKIWILGKNIGLLNSKIATTDTSGLITTVALFADSFEVANDFDISSTHIAIAGTENTEINRNMFVKTFLNDGESSIFNADAGVIGVRYDTTYAVHVQGYPQTNDIYFDTYVTVKNFGQDTLNTVFVNSKLWAVGPCSHNYYLNEFTGLNLLPDDSVELHLGLLYDFYFCAGICTYNYCFWTSCPNDKVDKNHFNDSTCYDFILDIPDANNKITRDDNSFSILPNPATTSFTIKNISSPEKSLLQILNPFGEIIYTTTLNNKQETINSKLPQGIYFVRVSDGEKIVTQKLVVE